MKFKSWQLWLFASICFIFVGIMDLLSKKYGMSFAFFILGISYVFLSSSYYKKGKK